jgi:hypothetical protein
MESIGVHLNECPYCRGEYQSLLDTKRLLASLAHRTSRAEIESLLKTEDSRLIESSPNSFFRGALRPKPLAATALLSLAGLWVASASLDTPTDGVTPGSGGIPTSMSAATMTMPGFGVGIRGLRYLNDMAHGGIANASPVMIPVNSSDMVISGDGVRYRHPVSLSAFLSTTTDNRLQAAPVAISVYTASDGNMVLYSGVSGNSGMYSVSVQRHSAVVVPVDADRLR